MTATNETARARQGTARAALGHRDFRVLWFGALGSNIGTWMQNTALGAFAWSITHELSFVALLSYVQLVPQFFLAAFAGVLAERHSRKTIIIVAALVQMAATVALALTTGDGAVSRPLLVICVLIIGLGNAYFFPSFGSVVPSLVGKEDLPGAVSLQFVQLNVSRVIGPVIGLWIFRRSGIHWVFWINAASFLILIAAVLAIRPSKSRAVSNEPTLARIRAGFVLVWRTPILRWPILTIASMSMFCLAFLGLMPAIADERYGIGSKTVGYQWLFASFALGAALGAIGVGSFLTKASQVLVARNGLVLFSLALIAFGTARSKSAAYPLAFTVGVTYFVVATSLSTALQKSLSDDNRGRVLAIWFMAFGGMIPWGTQLMGTLADRTDLGVSLVLGGVVAALLAAWTHRLRPTLGTA